MKNIFFVCMASMTLGLWAVDPSITDVNVSYDENARAVEITYTLEDAPAIVTLDILTNGVSVAVPGGAFDYISGDVHHAVAAGERTIRWAVGKALPEADIPSLNVTAEVFAWRLDEPPDYLVVDLASSNSVEYVADTNHFMHGGVDGALMRTRYMPMRLIPAAGQTFTLGRDLASDTLSHTPSEAERTVTFPSDGNFYMAIFELTNGQMYFASGIWTYGIYRLNNEEIAYRPVSSLNRVQFWLNGGNSTNATVIVDAYPNGPRAGTQFWNMRSDAGLPFMLPSEAQWEFAACGGSDSAHWGDASIPMPADVSGANSVMDRLGLYDGNRDKSTGGHWNYDYVGPGVGSQCVGKYAPNGYGLYDMFGNNAEHCQDNWYKDPSLVPSDGSPYVRTYAGGTPDMSSVVKGGSLIEIAGRCRTTSRAYLTNVSSGTKYFPDQSIFENENAGNNQATTYRIILPMQLYGPQP